MELRIKRVYDPPTDDDGCRILVDRLWPRGLTKERAQLDAWLKEIAPSNELRRWYGHDPGKWDEFRERYFKELDDRSKQVDELLELVRKGPATLLFSSKELRLNNAVALKEYLASRQ